LSNTYGGVKMKYMTIGVLVLIAVSLLAVGVSAFGKQKALQEKQGIESGIEPRIKPGIKPGIEQGFDRGFGNMMGLSNEDRNQIKEHYTAIQAAIENNDYDSWNAAVASMNELRALDTSKDAFDAEVQKYEEMQSRSDSHDAIQKALAESDYETFKSLVESMDNIPPMLEQVTKENFNRFIEMHNAVQNNDFETAKFIAEELGLQRPGIGGGPSENNHGMRQGKGFRLMN
jgi:hypothetical protein